LLWRRLDQISPLPVEFRYKRLKKLVERRSKGKLFAAKDRVTGIMVTVREINTKVCNAGFDDGIPTSVLREYSNLAGLKHPNLAQIYKV